MDMLRSSGVGIIGDMDWGTHFCHFYQTKEDLTNILVPYFKAGLENNEFCMWITSNPLSVEEAIESMQKVMPDIKKYLDTKQLEIIPYNEWYINDDEFNSKNVLKGWVEKVNESTHRGYERIRVTGNVSFLDKKDWDDLIDYEEKLDRIVDNLQIMVLCSYPLDECDANQIIDAVNKHQFTLIKREGNWTMVENTRHKKTEEALNQVKERFDRQLDQLTYITSHDLQEPIRMVISFSQLLKRRYKGIYDEDADEYIDFIMDGAHRMKDLIDDLQTFSQLNTRAKKSEPVHMDVVLNEVLDNLKTSITYNESQISYDYLPVIMGDPSQINQLFHNLITNAIKFQREGPPKIHISVGELSEKWLFSVKDEGIGIHSRYHEQIFKIFKRLHPREKYEGTGIGLVICKRIVERHGGRIWVESKLGEGSTFYFELPKIIS